MMQNDFFGDFLEDVLLFETWQNCFPTRWAGSLVMNGVKTLLGGLINE